VRHTAAYRHFASKDAIVSALAARAFTRMAALFETVAERCGEDVAAHIAGLADAYLAMVRDEPGAYRVMFADLPCTDDVRDTAARKCFEALHDAFSEGQRAGLVRSDLPAIAIAASNWSALHGMSMLLLDRRLEEGGPVGGSATLSSILRKVQREGWAPRQERQ